ncbi:MAG: hypothetical protein KAY32_17360 [Candidatus Eisenbacteria sp.]|nr:hypothetical protein [Candidatus Eisenbacteria bacterium]
MPIPCRWADHGDGLLLDGLNLYVVQNALNQIAVVRLVAGYNEGWVVDQIADPGFRVPATVHRFGNALYAVNARFDVAATPDTEYEVVRVSRRSTLAP